MTTHAICHKRYSRIIPLSGGPRSHDLGVGLTYITPNEHTISVSFTGPHPDNPKILSGYTVRLSCLSELYEPKYRFRRDNWYFEGQFEHGEDHIDEAGERRLRYAKVEGEYNLRSKKGELRVLHFDQPRPVVELIPAGKKFALLQERIGCIVDAKTCATGKVIRFRIKKLDQWPNYVGERFVVEADNFVYKPAARLGDPGTWEPYIYPHVLVYENTPMLLWEDGRVVFIGHSQAQGLAGNVECTVYPKDFWWDVPKENPPE